MRRMVRGLALAAALALGTTAGGCAGYGLEDVLEGGLGTLSGHEVQGEIRGVNTRSRYLDVSTYNGRNERVRYDSRTRVVYGGREYRASALERGDEVSIRVTRDRDGYLYADHVRVRSNRGDDGRYGSRDRDGDWDRDRRERDRHERERRERDRDRDRDRYEYNQSLEGRVVRVERVARRVELRASNGRRVWATLRQESRDREDFARLREGQHVRLTGRWAGNDRFVIDRIR